MKPANVLFHDVRFIAMSSDLFSPTLSLWHALLLAQLNNSRSNQISDMWHASWDCTIWLDISTNNWIQIKVFLYWDIYRLTHTHTHTHTNTNTHTRGRERERERETKVCMKTTVGMTERRERQEPTRKMRQGQRTNSLRGKKGGGGVRMSQY